jgi:hypothetical protein
MSKKFVFSVVVKSRRKMFFFEANNVTNVMFVVVSVFVNKPDFIRKDLAFVFEWQTNLRSVGSTLWLFNQNHSAHA